MPLTKQYLRFATAGVFGLVASNHGNVVFLDLKLTKTKYCAVPACENVIIWDLRVGEKVLELQGDKHEVSVLAKSPDKRHLAVGYEDGTVRVFDLQSGDATITFSGHRSAVTALNYDHAGVQLVSGSKDTDVIVWDIINEAGLFRLRGHKGVITQARFMSTCNVLFTSSKDMYVKFWDLETQHCFRTLVDHKTEVWSFVLTKDEKHLITGSGDSELRVWRLLKSDKSNEDSSLPRKRPKLQSLGLLDSDQDDEIDEEEMGVLSCAKIGSLMRQGRDRVVSMTMDPTGRILGCHGSENSLELFKVQSEEELNKRLQKRQKKAKKRARESGEPVEDVKIELSLEDEIMRMTVVKMSSKLRSFDCFLEQVDVVKVICLLGNNSLHSCVVDVTERNGEVTAINKLTLPGHRTDARTLTFSSDNTAILSASGDSMKIWNRATMQCIRTMSCDYALCSLFAPGDRHVILGTKSGKLQIFDIASGTLLETIDAHAGAVWSVCMAPDKHGLVSGSADHEVKFWDFELVTDQEHSAGSKRLTLVHTRTLKMAEDVLCLKFSPDHKLLAVSLLDNTVKVFFTDTLKFFLSLYGHKLPVLCMDISSDSQMLVTGSADRNVKLWGLDFGDCHKSIFAHDDSIMCVQFIPKTHMFFTGGKDRKVKQWDGDSFDHILTLQGHHGEVWCMAISPSGNFLVSGGHDRSLRLWEKTDEPLVLEEEREMEREKEYEESVGQGDEPVVPGETNKETGIAGKKTIETVKAAERLIEAIEIYREESAKLKQHKSECEATGKQLPDLPVHPMLQAYKVSSPDRYVLEVIRKIRSSELEEALLVLPFAYVPDLLCLLDVYVAAGWEVELSCRCLFFLLRIHQGQITSNQVLLPVIDRLRSNTKQAVCQIRDTIGFNLAGLKFLQHQQEEKEQVKFFADATDKMAQKKKKEKKRAILTMTT